MQFLPEPTNYYIPKFPFLDKELIQKSFDEAQAHMDREKAAADMRSQEAETFIKREIEKHQAALESLADEFKTLDARWLRKVSTCETGHDIIVNCEG